MPILKFCLLQADYITEGGGNSERPLIRLWGRTDDGKSVAVIDRGFAPYFYAQHSASISKADLTLLKNRIMDLNIEGRNPTKVEETGRNFLGKPVKLLKVSVGLPSDVPKFRELLKDWREIEDEFEYGINFNRRYMIDKALSPMDWVNVEGNKIKGSGISADIVIEADKVDRAEGNGYPDCSVLAFDIETFQESGNDKIIMVSFMDNRGFKKVITAGKKKAGGIEAAGTEKGLLKRFVEIVAKKDPDVIVGYNTDGFDFPKIAEKADACGVRLALGRDSSRLYFKRQGRKTAALMHGRIHIDIYDFVERILSSGLSTEVLTLDRVSHELIGEGKIDMSCKDIEAAWKSKDVASIGRYCLRDSELTLKLAKNLLPQIFEISRVAGQLPSDISRMSYSQLVEWLLIRKAFNVGEVVPNRPKYGEIARRRSAAPYTGGYVHQPKEGIHENISLFDFASLYPSITITHNISPETVDCRDCKSSQRHHVPEAGHHFCGSKRGFVPMVLEELVNKRNEIKSRMDKLGTRTAEYKALHNRQYALKIIANASYGYYGYAGSRWYSRICAESITAWGRSYIKDVIEMAQKGGYEVIYGDTDSLFVKIRTKKESRQFLKAVNDKLPGVMELDFRDSYEAGIFVTGKTTGLAAKKRYALIDGEGNLTIRGFEKVRRDWSDIAKDTQESVIKAILKDRSPDKAVRIVRRTIENIKKRNVGAEDLVIHTHLTKPIQDYEAIGPHVIAAKKMIKHGIEVREGSTIKYFIAKGPGSISERAEPVDIMDEGGVQKYYDPDYYIHNQVIPAALRVLSGLGYKEDDLTSKKRLEQVSLSDFVKK
jgi:DNA polymerase elongation subunit (family B)